MKGPVLLAAKLPTPLNNPRSRLNVIKHYSMLPVIGNYPLISNSYFDPMSEINEVV